MGIEKAEHVNHTAKYMVRLRVIRVENYRFTTDNAKPEIVLDFLRGQTLVAMLARARLQSVISAKLRNPDTLIWHIVCNVIFLFRKCTTHETRRDQLVRFMRINTKPCVAAMKIFSKDKSTST